MDLLTSCSDWHDLDNVEVVYSIISGGPASLSSLAEPKGGQEYGVSFGRALQHTDEHDRTLKTLPRRRIRDENTSCLHLVQWEMMCFLLMKPPLLLFSLLTGCSGVGRDEKLLILSFCAFSPTLRHN